MSGCGLEGKLIERPWKLVDFVFKGEAAILFFCSNEEKEKP
jgi:hypothetical protein